jgi:hypothetical protein
MSQVVALVHKVKGTFRRNDPFVKYMDKIVSTADSHAAETQPAAVDLDDDIDVDFFDRQDLGVLNRRLRKVRIFHSSIILQVGDGPPPLLPSKLP